MRWLLTLLLLAIAVELSAQTRKLEIRSTDVAPVIDGKVDSIWLAADMATDFHMVLPMDTSAAKVRTEVRMMFDAETIFLLAVCYHGAEGNYMVESLRRDFNFGKNDNFLAFIDTFNDKINGFSFGANAAGAQWDGVMYDGGKVDLTWDNQWRSEVENYSDKWIFEMAVPFKSIRFKKGITQWGINFSRLDLKTTEKSSWSPVPRQFPTASLAYAGTLSWAQPPPHPGANISLIPYASARIGKDFGSGKPSREYPAGFDAKIGVTASLNLDLTVNPDFSQVEVDRQVTNLDRFELFFPERRQFFLENGDLFGNLGYASLRPFFSRRIGLGVPIIAGARLSGKINRDWRVGAMDIQTERIDSIAQPGQNFSVFALQRRVFSRSTITAFFINKQSVNYSGPPSADFQQFSLYNRNLGLEYNLASPDNRWTGKLLTVKSFHPDKTGKDLTFAGNLQYSSRKWTVGTSIEKVGVNFTAETGYVPRTGYVKASPLVSRLFFPKSKKILSHGPLVQSTVFFNPNLKETDSETYLYYKFTLRKQSTLAAWVAHNYVLLLRGFDPTNSGKDTLSRGTKHQWNAWGLEAASKPQQLLTWSFTTRAGGYYAGGSRFNLTFDGGYRIQPYFAIAISTSYNQIKLPAPWKTTNFWLVGPRIDLTATNKLFFTTFLQYNQQQNNININSRLQWRYKPASDFYIVYTDNYFPENFRVKSRALIFKFTYWWNL